MQTNVSINKDEAVIRLSGRFDFNAHRDFRASYEPLIDNVAVRSLTFDLGSVDYLDSSALGMLLMVRDKATAANKRLALSNAKAGVLQVLNIANFSKLFQIN
jgi:anti-anti-sigma factor